MKKVVFVLKKLKNFKSEIPIEVKLSRTDKKILKETGRLKYQIEQEIILRTEKDLFNTEWENDI